MRIRSKLVVLIAVPLIALGVAAAFGFSNQSVVIETAEDAVEAVSEAQAVYDAVLAIGDERLLQIGGDVGSPTDVAEATDASLDALASDSASSATTDAVEQVREMVQDSRNAEPAESQAILGDAAGVLLALDVDSASDYPSATSRNAAVVNQTAVEALQLREWAWIAYLGAEQADSATIATLTTDFANAQSSIRSAQQLDSDGGSARIDMVLQSEAGTRLTELEIVALDDLTEQELSVTSDSVLGALAEFRGEWAEAIGNQGDLLRAEVQDDLRSANDLRSLFTLLAAVGVVVLAGLIFVVYRSITNPLESLLVRASSVANEDLPQLVDALRHDDGSADLPVAQVIPVTSDDEIGELVSAFNDVQITAYDLATEQALGRRNVADMFVNLGRRNQQLLQRILAQLTQLEQDEEDPEKLRDLFELDNVVTRMRRNAESLLALAGAQTARQWSQPIAIENTVRAAFGEVEGYERIDVADLAEVRVIGSVVADITHLLAELLENAINFSEPTTSVVVNGRLEARGYVVTVVDQGIGMSQRELSDGNQRITDPPPLDQVPTRFLGLYVVGRLAERHGIEAKLSETTTGGIAAKVTLPLDLIVTTEDEKKRAAELKPVEAEEVEETETSPLEEEHDLDAELASMTSELTEDSTDDSDADSNSNSDSDSDSDDDSDDDLSAKPSISSPAVRSDSGLPTRSRKGDRQTNTSVAELDPSSEQKTNEQKTKEPKAEKAPVEQASEPETNDLGLPVRNRGGALEQTTVSIDRANVLEREATDASPEAAGNFSSMMSALTSGVARGLEASDSDSEDSKEENDK